MRYRNLTSQPAAVLGNPGPRAFLSPTRHRHRLHNAPAWTEAFHERLPCVTLQCANQRQISDHMSRDVAACTKQSEGDTRGRSYVPFMCSLSHGSEHVTCRVILQEIVVDHLESLTFSSFSHNHHLILPLLFPSRVMQS